MITIDLLTWVARSTLVPLVLFVFFLIKGLIKRNKKDFKLAGFSLLGSVALFILFGLMSDHPRFADEFTEIDEQPVAQAVLPEVETEADAEETGDLLPPAVVISILKEEPLSVYGEFAFDEKLDVMTFTPDINDDMYGILLLAASGETEDYEQLKIWFEGISESVWNSSEVPFGVLNPEDTDKSLLWYENGQVIFDFLEI